MSNFFLHTVLETAIAFVCLRWKAIGKHGNTMTYHKHCCLPRSYLHAVLSTFNVKALQIFIGHRLVPVVSIFQGGVVICGTRNTLFLCSFGERRWEMGSLQKSF